MEDRQTVIIDNGSGHMKAGMAGEEAPSAVFPAIIGRPKHGQAMVGSATKEFYLGEDAQAKKGVLSITYPLEHGIVRDWGDMEKIWHYTFYDALRVNPDEHPVIVTEAPLNPKKNRERMVEMLFEKFSVPAVFIVIQAVMSLYSEGRTTGCVVDSGDGVTHVVPVYEGYAMPYAIVRLDLAGRDLSEYMVKILSEGGTSMTSSAEREIVRLMKEKICYVLVDVEYNEAMRKCQEQPMDYEAIYELPDGNKVTLNSERFRVTEVLFDPLICGRELPGIHLATFNCVTACPIDVRAALYQNIILSGGNTMFPGLRDRLEKELKALVPQKMKVSVLASPQRRYIVWMGASVVAQLSGFSDMLVWKNEYDEVGPKIVHCKCF